MIDSFPGILAYFRTRPVIRHGTRPSSQRGPGGSLVFHANYPEGRCLFETGWVRDWEGVVSLVDSSSC